MAKQGFGFVTWSCAGGHTGNSLQKNPCNYISLLKHQTLNLSKRQSHQHGHWTAFQLGLGWIWFLPNYKHRKHSMMKILTDSISLLLFVQLKRLPDIDQLNTDLVHSMQVQRFKWAAFRFMPAHGRHSWFLNTNVRLLQFWKVPEQWPYFPNWHLKTKKNILRLNKATSLRSV